MNNDSPSGRKDSVGTERFRLMEQPKLEALAIKAITTHRVMMEADQEVYLAWVRASEDPSISREVVETLKVEYLARLKKSEDQMAELSAMLDALGYIPEVPDGTD